MTEGFGKGEIRAERSIEKSSKEIAALRRVIEKYKDDPNGRRKMLKKMKKYWSSNLAVVKSLDYKPKGSSWTLSEGLADNIAAIQQSYYADADGNDTREEVAEEEVVLNDGQIAAIRDMISK